MRYFAFRLRASAAAVISVALGGLALAAANTPGANIAPVRLPPGIAEPVPNSRADARYGDPAHTDFSGLWSNDQFVGLIDYSKALPLTKAYAEKLRAFSQRVVAGDQPPDSVNQCVAIGMPRFFTLAFEVLQTPGQVTMISNVLDDVRRIYTDGSGITPGGELSYNGHSAGRWQGADLVIETRDLKASTIDTNGIPYSEKLSIVERWHLLAPGKLEVTLTLTDSEAFTRPWVITNTYTRLPAGARFEQYACENNRWAGNN
jgi:hypothetical protein